MRALPAVIVSLALVASACSDDGSSAAPQDTDAGATDNTDDKTVDKTVDNTDAPTTTGADSAIGGGSGRGDGSGGQFVRALAPFADCAAFLDHVKTAARERVGPYGLDGGPVAWFEDGRLAPDDMAAEEPAAEAEGAPVPVSDGGGGDAASYTDTNVQELGVGEPDIIKTDGERILVVSENVLTAIDASEMVVTDRIALPEGWGHELFFAGDRALLFTNEGQWGYPMPVEPLDDLAIDGDAESQFAEPGPIDDIAPADGAGPSALILEVDLSNPAALAITASMRIEGRYLSARSIGDTVRLAVSSGPNQLPWVLPQSETGEERAAETNRAIIDESTLDDWVPSYHLTSRSGSDAGPLLSCGRMHHPAEFSGFDIISIVDLDLADGLGRGFDPSAAVGVLAGGQTIYSSTDRFYVATTKWAGADLATDEARWREWTEDYETDLHAFAIEPGAPTDYVASGTVAGSLLNQFSLDEYDGYLRVIATDGSPWDDNDLSETRLVVMHEQGDRLVPVGEVGGLGRGEQLYSARLLDDIGFAVTFRQIDPFYVLDLRDPTNPRITGELKIPGVSTYLHPVSDDRVLGIGQDATEEGRTTGLKLSLFDVSDPADPREVSVWTLPNANSPAEWDHRAFQMSGSTAIVPVQSWGEDFNGAILFDIGETITELGRVSHLDVDAPPASDCRVITSDDLTEDASELFWMTTDGQAHVQVCEPGQVGGWGSWYCDRIPGSEIQFWYGDPSVAAEELGRLGIGDDSTIEICWPDGGYQEAVQRSLVIDDTLWTMTPSAVQANQLDDLSMLGQLPIR